MRTVSYIHRKKTISPYIRLSGQLLKKIGFDIGSKFIVQYKENEIILRSNQ